MPFVKYDQYPGSEFGAGDFTDHTGRKLPLYDPGLAQQLLAQNTSSPELNQSVSDTGNWSVDTGPAQIEGKPVANGKDYEAAASDFLKANRNNNGATQPTPDGKIMTVEPHPAAPERGLATEHPGVTVREPTDPFPKDFTPGERKAVASVAERFPGVSEQGILNIFKNESNFSPTAVNPKSGAAGIFQLMPDQQPAGQEFTKLSREEQIAQYGAYLEGKQKKFGPISSDADLAVANAAPALLGKPDGAVAYPAGSKEAQANPAWQDASGNVTVGAIKKYYGAAGGSGTPQTKQQALAAYINGSGGGLQTDEKTRTTTESGTPYTDEDKAGLFARTEKHNADIAAANQPALDAQANAIQQGIDTKQKIQQSLDDAQTREQAARTAYDDSMQRVRGGVDDVLADKAPPPFGGNIFATILASIAQGMGAYGAAINHTENFAANAINTALKRENDRWAQAHLDKQYKVKQDQELSRDQWYNYKSTLAERELQQRMLIDHELQQNMAVSKNADTLKSLGLIQADNNAKAEEINANLTRLARGKVTTEISSEQKQKEGNSLAEQNKRADEIVKSGKATKEEVAASRDAAVPVDDKELAKYSGGENGKTGRSSIDTTEASLKKLAPTLDLDYDEKTGTFTAKKGSEDRIPRNPISGEALGPMWSSASDFLHQRNPDDIEKRKRAFTALNTTINSAIYLASGKAINEEEAKRKVEEFKGLSREDQVANLNDIMLALRQQKSQLGSTYPGAEAAYERRLQDEKKKNEAPGFTPRQAP